MHLYNFPSLTCFTEVEPKLTSHSHTRSRLALTGTPVIFPTGPESTKEVFLSTYHKSIEVIGSSGHKVSEVVCMA